MTKLLLFHYLKHTLMSKKVIMIFEPTSTQRHCSVCPNYSIIIDGWKYLYHIEHWEMN